MEADQNDSVEKLKIRVIWKPKEKINLYHEEYQTSIQIVLKNEQKAVIARKHIHMPREKIKT